MTLLGIAFVVIALLSAAFVALGRSRAITIAGDDLSTLHSRPLYHGMFSGLWALIAGVVVLLTVSQIWSGWIDTGLMRDISQSAPEMSAIERELVLSDAKSMAQGNIASRSGELREDIAGKFQSADGTRVLISSVLAIGAAFVAGFFLFRKIDIGWRARNRTEALIRTLLLLCAAIAVLTTIGIVLSLIFETLSFFQSLGWRADKFLFGPVWSPLSGVHDGVLDADKVGAVPLFVGTLLITLIAMCVAVPVGLFSAIYLSDFASPRVRAWAKPLLEVLAGIPTVVYGFFAAITMAPALRGLGEALGLSVASESALAAGLVMGIMIIPFVSSLSDDVINAVPQSLRDGSYGLGATKAETMRQVVLPAALPGIVSAVLLGISRAVGETMIVVMAAGQGANLTINPLEAVTTVTVQIVMLITGDTEASTAAGPAFTLGFTLFCVTLALNIIALRIVRKYREAYD
jgi:phosphate transport system permease protein